MYSKLKDHTADRGQSLEQTLGVSEKFWDELNNLGVTLKDIQDTLVSQEPPALEPDMIREQQEALEVNFLFSEAKIQSFYIKLDSKLIISWTFYN